MSIIQSLRHSGFASSFDNTDDVDIFESFALNTSSDTHGSGCERQSLLLDIEVLDLPPPQKFVSRGAKIQGKGPACVPQIISKQFKGHFRRMTGEVIAREESGLWSHDHEGVFSAADHAARVISAFQLQDSY